MIINYSIVTKFESGKIACFNYLWKKVPDKFMMNIKGIYAMCIRIDEH